MKEILQHLEHMFTSEVIGPNAAPSPAFDAFEKLLDLNDLEIFIDLWNSTNPILKAWAFLGISRLLQEKKAVEVDSKHLTRIQNIIKELLIDDREIQTLLGCRLTHRKLNDIHLLTLNLLDGSIINAPILEYCKSEKSEINRIIGFLLENTISKITSNETEKLLLKIAKRTKVDDFETKDHVIEAIKKYYRRAQKIENKSELDFIFRLYLKENKEGKTEFQMESERDRMILSNYKQNIQANIIYLAMQLDLDFKKEIIEFIKNLVHQGSWVLPEIIEKFSNDEIISSVILEKLSNTTDSAVGSNLISGMMKTNFPNWREHAKKYIKRNKRINLPTLREMRKQEFIDEEIMTTCLVDGHADQHMFIPEFFGLHPKIFDQWKKFQAEFRKILKIEEPRDLSARFHFYNKKKTVLTLVKILKRNEFIQEIMENLKNLKNANLRVIAAEAIGEIGTKDQLNELKELLERDYGLKDFTSDGINPILTAINKIEKRS
ncbi:MAG: hypothetical protein ACTSVY_05140 [Candidatus Helarchaeota archaeon]